MTLGNGKNVKEAIKEIADKLGVGKDDFNKSVYILLDRTGSMSSLWDEAVGSINAYIDALDDSVNVYVACFDATSFDVLRKGPKSEINEIARSEVSPRGMTNLYDATAKVINQMLEDNPSRAVFVCMTDGYENASREYNLAQVKNLLKKVENKKWANVFLGAEFKDVTIQTSSMGVKQDYSTFAARGLVGTAMNLAATKSMDYFSTGDVRSMAYSSTEKEMLSGSDPTLTGTNTKKDPGTTHGKGATS